MDNRASPHNPMLLEDIDRLTDERDRYKAALERIASQPCAIGWDRIEADIARRALGGVDFRTEPEMNT